MLEGVASNIESLIMGLGRSSIVRTYAQSGTSYNPALTPSDVSVTAVFSPYKAGAIDGVMIQSDDKKAYISSTEAVTKQDKIVDGGLEYNIENLRCVQPGDDKFLYIAQLRK